MFPQIAVMLTLLSMTIFATASEAPSEASNQCLEGKADFCRTNDPCQTFYNETCFEHMKGKPEICKEVRKCIEDTFLNFNYNLRHGQHMFGNVSVCSKLDVLTAYCNTEGCKKTYTRQCFEQGPDLQKHFCSDHCSICIIEALKIQLRISLAQNHIALIL